jgi:hypothetical protein
MTEAAQELIYGYPKHIHERAEMYIEQYLGVNQTSLVSDMLAENFRGLEYSDIENVYDDCSSWDVEDCDNRAEEYGFDLPDKELYTDEDGFDEDAWLEEARETCSQYEDPAEIYQWFVINNEWMAEQLKAAGQCVLEDGWNMWWGRQACGQAIILDGTFQRIAEKWSHL